MSAPSSPPPSAGYVPYLPYKSKRHSRNLSGSHLTPNQSPPPVTKSTPNALLRPRNAVLDNSDDDVADSSDKGSVTPPNVNEIVDHAAPITVVVDPPPAPDRLLSESQTELASGKPEPLHNVKGPSGMLLSSSKLNESLPSSSQPPQSSSTPGTPKKTSTFRRLPAKTAHTSLSAPHSRTTSTTSLPPRLAEHQVHTELRASPAPAALIPQVPPLTTHIDQARAPSIQPSSSHASHASTASVAAQSTPTNLPSRINSPTPVPLSKRAPYRPGFQPKGAYRQLTDEFIERRRLLRDGEDQGGITRVERTKLERRLEKLIALHFSHPDHVKQQTLSPQMTRRTTSSLFDFQSLRGMDAGDLWRGVVRGGLGDSSKMDIRASEQRITPWQDDAAVSKCPLCLAAFHPLTNRKHHCRLCGQIICSLPIKHPQRTSMCSSLFVVDVHTRLTEEVGEGVDYGVKRRRVVSAVDQQLRQEDEDKFLKGVRICRDCRPVLLHQQYNQQAKLIPPFVKMYENFINLEADIEEALPKFQELIMSLTHHDQPTKEASTVRKRLLESFARYDKLSKDIRALPCPNGPGSSQDRIQAAIMMRANIFLQKNMFPLQSLPTPQAANKVPKSANGTSMPSISVDPDSELAHALQPLLEQETLLESFVEEARAQRKFEDVKTLKVNLTEIRQEIERLLDGKKP